MPVLKRACRRRGAIKKEFGRDCGKTAGLLLAAGASSRMGWPKQLLQAGQNTLLGRVLHEVLRSELDKVFLILGHEAEKIRRSLASLPCHPKLTIVMNRDYRQGISTSIIAGLKQAEKTHDHVMILLADMPAISAKLINHLLHHYLRSGLPLGAVKVKERRSHPVIFSRKLYPELHKLKGDSGARGLFRVYAHEVCLVDAEEIFEDRDIDTPEDYMKFKASLHTEMGKTDEAKSQKGTSKDQRD
jgi:molybdenum cofactor cytidylyltransferase